MDNYNLSLVFLSYVVAVIGSFMALITVRNALVHSIDSRNDLVMLASLCLGGMGIWSMHFIGMLAFSMPNMNMNYHWGMTAFSLIIGVVVVYVGLAVVSAEKFNFPKLIMSGVFVGLGVAAMHYTGMLAMQMQADMQWNWTIIIISIAIAITASIVALWLLLHIKKLWHIVISALVMGVAVCGMHYTGMTAVTFIHNSTLPYVEAMSDNALLFFSLVIAGINLIIITVSSMVALADSANYSIVNQKSDN
jgi:NO-binding membrane sensor protein with MHYT domain